MTLRLFVVTENETAVPLANGQSAAVPNGGGSPLNVSRLRRLGMFQMADGELRRPARVRIKTNASRPRVDASGIEIPSLLVGFAAVEAAHRVAEHPALCADRHYTAGDVRRVLHMMAKRRLRNLRC